MPKKTPKKFESKYELVIVEWEDIATKEGWNTESDMMSAATAYCVSVGFLLDLDKDKLVLCSGYSDDGDMTEVTAYPRGTILKITYLNTRKGKHNDKNKSNKN